LNNAPGRGQPLPLAGGFNLREGLAGMISRYRLVAEGPMAPARRKRRRQHVRRHSLGRESLRAFFAGAFLAGVFALALFVSGVSKPQQTAPAASRHSTEQEDDELRTGAILFIPFQGNNCRQHMFDNISGRIWFFGYVDCESAISRYAGDGARRWSSARVDAIRDGFWKN
jgi:hypothetical protein